MTTRGHDMPFGTKVSQIGVRFALWAPDARTVDVIVDNGPPRPMSLFNKGWHRATATDAHDGSSYRFQWRASRPGSSLAISTKWSIWR
jgi:maltooligosyltrehalose trehalohydrolase